MEKNDVRRPLSCRGFTEAEGLVSTLSPWGISRIASSPSLRCLQTVDPLARHLHLDVGQIEDLSPRRRTALKWIREVPDTGVLLACSHGEVIKPILAELHEQGRPRPCPRADTGKRIDLGPHRRGRAFDDARFSRLRPLP